MISYLKKVASNAIQKVKGVVGNMCWPNLEGVGLTNNSLTDLFRLFRDTLINKVSDLHITHLSSFALSSPSGPSTAVG